MTYRDEEKTPKSESIDLEGRLRKKVDDQHKQAPPARQHSGQARQAGEASGLAGMLASVAAPRDRRWYNEYIGVGDSGDRDSLDKARATALDKFVTGVTKGLSNCSVYFDFDFRGSSFSAGVLAFFNYGSGWYNANYVTSHISYGLDGPKMTREIDNVIRAISTELGQRVFTGTTEPIPDKFLKMVKRVSK